MAPEKKRRRMIPVCDFGQTLRKWCGLSVKEVNAEIETMDHRRKTTKPPSFAIIEPPQNQKLLTNQIRPQIIKYWRYLGNNIQYFIQN